jgi:hypothetical protein
MKTHQREEGNHQMTNFPGHERGLCGLYTAKSRGEKIMLQDPLRRSLRNSGLNGAASPSRPTG